MNNRKSAQESTIYKYHMISAPRTSLLILQDNVWLVVFSTISGSTIPTASFSTDKFTLKKLPIL